MPIIWKSMETCKITIWLIKMITNRIVLQYRKMRGITPKIN